MASDLGDADPTNPTALLARNAHDKKKTDYRILTKCFEAVFLRTYQYIPVHTAVGFLLKTWYLWLSCLIVQTQCVLTC